MDLDLFDGEDDTQVLSINKEYAERYQNWREKEEVQKIKDRYGDAAALKMAFDDEDGSTSEEEDENAEALTEDVEKEFFRTLSYLKQKDPKIYDENTEFFSNSDKIKGKERNKIKEKPVFLKDYERELLLKTEGKVDKLEGNEWTSSEKQSKGYFEEQEEIKKNLKRLVDESDEDESEDLLVVRKKSDKEKATEEAEYRAWLLGQTTNVKDTYFKEDTRALHDVWTDPNLDKNEAFLRDFILNKRYLDQEDDNHIPTYNEIVHDSEGDLSEDEETLEKQGEFENKFNFRFEEPDHDFIKRYPRTIANSLRRKDDSRPKKRQEKIERKKEEKQRKKEELKILKAAKRREIEEKLEKLAEITGL